MNVETVYIDYASHIYRYLYSLTRNKMRAEDLLHDVFLKAYPAIIAGHVREWKPWLFKVAYYTYVDDQRSSNRSVTNEMVNQLSNEETPEDFLLRNERMNGLLQLLDSLSPNEQQALLLCDIHGWTNQEAAQILDMNINTLKSHLRRGRKKMKQRLLEEESNEI